MTPITREEIAAEAWFGDQRERVLALLDERDAAREEKAHLVSMLDMTDKMRLTAETNLEVERDATALLSATVTTLTEQRDLCAAKAERMRAALSRAKEDLFEIGSNCDCDCGCANCVRVEESSERIAVALASHSTAAQALAERDERLRRPLEAKLAEVTAERDAAKKGAATHWVSFCERSGDFAMWRAAVTSLAASQAYVAELQAVLKQILALTGADQFGNEIDQIASAALARESNTDALREFAERVIRRKHNNTIESDDTIIESVLKGDAT